MPLVLPCFLYWQGVVVTCGCGGWVKTKDPCCLRQSGDNVVLAGRLTRATRDSRVRRKACSVEERKERKGLSKGVLCEVCTSPKQGCCLPSL